MTHRAAPTDSGLTVHRIPDHDPEAQLRAMFCPVCTVQVLAIRRPCYSGVRLLHCPCLCRVQSSIQAASKPDEAKAEILLKNIQSLVQSYEDLLLEPAANAVLREDLSHAVERSVRKLQKLEMKFSQGIHYREIGERFERATRLRMSCIEDMVQEEVLALHDQVVRVSFGKTTWVLTTAVARQLRADLSTLTTSFAKVSTSPCAAIAEAELMILFRQVQFLHNQLTTVGAVFVGTDMLELKGECEAISEELVTFREYIGSLDKVTVDVTQLRDQITDIASLVDSLKEYCEEHAPGNSLPQTSTAATPISEQRKMFQARLQKSVVSAGDTSEESRSRYGKNLLMSPPDSIELRNSSAQSSEIVDSGEETTYNPTLNSLPSGESSHRSSRETERLKATWLRPLGSQSETEHEGTFPVKNSTKVHSPKLHVPKFDTPAPEDKSLGSWEETDRLDSDNDSNTESNSDSQASSTQPETADRMETSSAPANHETTFSSENHVLNSDTSGDRVAMVPSASSGEQGSKLNLARAATQMGGKLSEADVHAMQIPEAEISTEDVNSDDPDQPTYPINSLQLSTLSPIEVSPNPTRLHVKAASIVDSWTSVDRVTWKIRARSLRGHTGELNCCSASKDGSKLLSGSDDCTLRLWDMGKSKTTLELKGHTKIVRCCAILPNGKLAVSGSADSTVRLWDLSSGLNKLTLTGHSAAVRSCAVSGDGRYCLTGSNDKTVRLWDLEIGDTIVQLGGTKLVRKGHSGSVLCCSFVDGGGQLALSGSKDKTLRLWKLPHGKIVRVLRGHTDAVYSCCVYDGGRKAVSGSNDQTIRVWNLSNGKTLHTLRGHVSCVERCDVFRAGGRLLSCSFDGDLRVWDLHSNKTIRVFKGHNEAVYDCAVVNDGEKILSCGKDKTLKVWQCELNDTGSSQSVTSAVTAVVTSA